MSDYTNVALPKAALSPHVRDILNRIEDPLLDTKNAVSLPIDCYTSEEWFQFERRAIWDREWIGLGHVGLIPTNGDYFSIEINGDPFLVVRGDDSKIRVMPAVCQHRGHILGNKEGNVEKFTCPYHGWAYKLDGTLSSAPGMGEYATLENLRESHCLPILRSEIWNGFVFVNLDGRARPLGPRLKSLTEDIKNYRMDELIALPTEDYPHNPWNWKWMQENGLEPYHTPVAHKGYHDWAPARLSEFPRWSDKDDGAVYYSTRFTHIDGNFNETQKCLFPAMQTLTEEDRWRVMFGVVPPNLLIAALPDSAFYLITCPEGANSITLRVGFLFPEETQKLPDFNKTLERVIEGFNIVNDQDIRANESIQKGRNSRFAQQGRVAPLEIPLVQLGHWFVSRYKSYALDVNNKG